MKEPDSQFAEHGQELEPLGGQRSGRSAEAIRIWDSQALFGGAREVRVRHGNQEYRLLITRNDKLILIK